ncbi:MAG: aldehyde dehydrogenase family protein [Thiotrichales bacterium]|nr:MAG: aldehyde dehydrogenase family protein [Thiotrichales bacterium]
MRQRSKEEQWHQAVENAGQLPDYLYINGERVYDSSLQSIESVDPGSGRSIGAVPAGNRQSIEAAVVAARSALQGPWRDLPPRERGQLLWRVGEAIRADKARLALVETLDNGKPLKDAEVCVERCADYFCYYAGMADKLEGSSVPLGAGKVCFTEHVPIGVTGHIIPWNVPLNMIARGLAPALTCGNTAVVKPAEDTSMTALLVVELMEKVGIPPGVVNVVSGYGHEAGQALAEHPDVHHVTFTGSVATGKTVMSAAAQHIASVSLELGGKSPHIILDDADLDRAVPDIVRAVFANSGQICSAGTRLLVQKGIYNELLDRLTQASSKLTLGHGLDNKDLGPLVSAKQLDTVNGFATRAEARGIKFVSGGQPVHPEGFEQGFYFPPSIAMDVPVDDELANDEVFGPILSVISVDDLEEAITIGNNSDYGLAAGIHTRDINRALKFARGIDAGQVYINGYHGAGDTVPFGGFKHSGIGREKGLAALNAYYEIKSVVVTLC